MTTAGDLPRWLSAPLPADEAERLAALHRLQVLDTPPEPAFDDLAFLASVICKTPVALVSLIDEKRQWFKAKVGVDVTQTPRDMAFCAHALLQPAELLEVGDASLDLRFADNPLVTGTPHIRFYAGAPLITSDNRALGTVCVIDRVPRRLSTPERQALSALARQVVAQLEQRQAVITDGQTGLPNRSAMRSMLQQVVQRAKRMPSYHFAVLLMDFDHFHLINDSLGHPTGDALLRQMAHRLQDALRGGDALARGGPAETLAARLGGDEFVILLDDLHAPSEAEGVTQRLLDVMSQPYLVDGHTVSSSASIGVVTSERASDVEDADILLRKADEAMYEAKRAGRACYVVFDEAMHERVARRACLAEGLRTALLPGQQGLFVVYQPIIELAQGREVEVEALVRWQDPQHGLLSPVEFIPVAEESGMIVALGERVLTTACGQFMQWQRSLGARAPSRVSVNVSRAQINKGQGQNFVHKVRDLLARFGMQASNLQLEVTESLAAQDQEVQATLHALRGLGVHLALDDFGTGYSSLSSLGEWPVDVLKLDRSFVSQVERSDHHIVLVEAALTVARSLGLSTVAEGVETHGQAAVLRHLGCTYAQGFLFSKPMTESECTQWLTQRS